MGEYDAMASMALRLIKKKGKPATLKRHVAGTYNPVTQTETGAQDLTFTMQTALVPPSRSKWFSPPLTVRCGHEAWIAAKGAQTAPTIGDILVTASGKEWKVFDLDEYKPDDSTAVAWRCYLEV